MKRAILLGGLAVVAMFTTLAHAEPFNLQLGDLVFQDLDGGPLCDAIEKVTRGIGGAKLSHIAMVSRVEGEEIHVIEAVSKGVVETPLETVLNRSQDEQGRPKALVGRLKPQYRHLIPKALETAKSFLGRPYDAPYVMENSAFYCSELVYESFRQANDGTPLFSLAPMTFVDPETATTFPAWVEYYDKLGAPVPEGEPGLNPGGMSRENVLDIVYAYGQLAGWNGKPGFLNVQNSGLTLDVMTFNIRYGTAKDGAHSWDHRRELVVEVITSFAPDVFGTQECLVFQGEYLAKASPSYHYFGMDRDADGGGEQTLIFYKKDLYVPLKTGTFWLSKTPDVPATKGWDATLNRIATWGILLDLRTRQRFFVLNTHLDHRSETARREGAKLIAERVDALSEGLPAVVMGDFNTKAGAGGAWDALTAAGFHDTWPAAKERRGPDGTFCGFEPRTEPPSGRIDWILTRPPAEVDWCEVIVPRDPERPSSDHYPVAARVRWAQVRE